MATRFLSWSRSMSRRCCWRVVGVDDAASRVRRLDAHFIVGCRRRCRSRHRGDTRPDETSGGSRRAGAHRASALWWQVGVGLGLAHADTLEGLYGLPRRRSVSSLSDYLSMLDALMAGKRATPNKSFVFSTRLGAELPTPPSVLIAALGPRCCNLPVDEVRGRSRDDSRGDHRELVSPRYEPPRKRLVVLTLGWCVSARLRHRESSERSRKAECCHRRLPRSRRMRQCSKERA